MEAVSLFSGCGGSDAGVIAAGFNIIMTNDKLPYARDVYLVNHAATDYKLCDIADVKVFPNAELLVGCYPCQGFSQGGMRQPSAKINTLYLEFARALGLIRPKAFVIENVSGMVRKNFSHLFQDQCRVFTEAGYRVHTKVLNAADFGVAQERKRIFIVGIRDDLGVTYQFPEPTHGAGRATPHKTIKQAIGDLPEWPEGEFYERDFHWYYLSRNRRQDWHQASKTIVANPRHMPLHPISPPLKKLAHNKWVFESDKPARRFSYHEAARLQGFANNFIFPDTPAGSLDMRYRVVGNAVPPPLFEAVVKALPNVWD